MVDYKSKDRDDSLWSDLILNEQQINHVLASSVLLACKTEEEGSKRVHRVHALALCFLMFAAKKLASQMDKYAFDQAYSHAKSNENYEYLETKNKKTKK